MDPEQKKNLMARIEGMVKHPEEVNFGIVKGRCDLEIVIVVADDDKAVFTEAALLQLKEEITAATGVPEPVIYLYGNEPGWLARGDFIN